MEIRYLMLLMLSILSYSCTTEVIIGKYVNDETKNKLLYSTLEIRNDSTFVYTKRGDLYFEESEGIWQIKRNKIFLNSFEHYKSPCLKQKDLNVDLPVFTNKNESIIIIENKSSLSTQLFKEIKAQTNKNTFKINESGEIRIDEPFDKVLIVSPSVGENEYQFKLMSFHNMMLEIVDGGCNQKVYVNDSLIIKNKKLLKADGSTYKLSF